MPLSLNGPVPLMLYFQWYVVPFVMLTYLGT